MSLKTGLVKIVISLTPNIVIKWVANIICKGIAHFSQLSFDMGTRTAYAQLTLNGEPEPLEVALDGFAFVNEGGCYLIIENAHANRPWLNNFFSRIVGKFWKIPAIPEYQAQINFIAELFPAENPPLESQ